MHVSELSSEIQYKKKQVKINNIYVFDIQF